MIAGFALQERPRRVIGSDGSATPAETRLIDLIARGEIEPGSNVLYAHLGGQPALNGYGGLFT